MQNCMKEEKRDKIGYQKRWVQKVLSLFVGKYLRDRSSFTEFILIRQSQKIDKKNIVAVHVCVCRKIYFCISLPIKTF